MWGGKVKKTCGACCAQKSAYNKTHSKTTKGKKSGKERNDKNNKKNSQIRADKLRQVKLDAAVEDCGLISEEIEEISEMKCRYAINDLFNYFADEHRYLAYIGVARLYRVTTDTAHSQREQYRWLRQTNFRDGNGDTISANDADSKYGFKMRILATTHYAVVCNDAEKAAHTHYSNLPNKLWKYNGKGGVSNRDTDGTGKYTGLFVLFIMFCPKAQAEKAGYIINVANDDADGE